MDANDIRNIGKQIASMAQRAGVDLDKPETAPALRVRLENLDIGHGPVYSREGAIATARLMAHDGIEQACRFLFGAVDVRATVREVRASLAFERGILRRERVEHGRAVERATAGVVRRDKGEAHKGYNTPTENLDRDDGLPYLSIPRYTEEEYRYLRQMEEELSQDETVGVQVEDEDETPAWVLAATKLDD